MTRLIRRWWKDERGATVVEYGILAVTISCVLLLGVNNVISAVVGVFSSVQAALTSP